MKALRFHGKRDLRLEDVAEPGPLGPREVLIRPMFVGICGTDLHEYAEGARVIPVKPHVLTGAMLPLIIGHEISGEVLDIGEAVTRTKPGDRVAIMPLISCGTCYYCTRGLDHLCATHGSVGLAYRWGGFAEYAAVPDTTIAVLPSAVSYEQGALIEPAAVASYAVDNSGLKGGESVLIAGAGPIGVFAALYAMAVGAGRVFVSETNPNRLNLAESLGVTAVFNPLEMTSKSASSRELGSGIFEPARSPLVEELRELTDGVGVDVAIDASGSEAGLASCINAIRGGGTVVEAALQTRSPSIDMHSLSLKDGRLIGTWCYRVYDFPRYLSLIAAGRFPVERAITSKIALEEAEEKGFKVLLDPKGEATKILVCPQS